MRQSKARSTAGQRAGGQENRCYCTPARPGAIRSSGVLEIFPPFVNVPNHLVPREPWLVRGGSVASGNPLSVHYGAVLQPFLKGRVLGGHEGVKFQHGIRRQGVGAVSRPYTRHLRRPLIPTTQ
eukprot:gene11121-biopygen21369